jgi:hypothetical protein
MPIQRWVQAIRRLGVLRAEVWFRRFADSAAGAPVRYGRVRNGRGSSGAMAITPSASLLIEPDGYPAEPLVSFQTIDDYPGGTLLHW